VRYINGSCDLYLDDQRIWTGFHEVAGIERLHAVAQQYCNGEPVELTVEYYR